MHHAKARRSIAIVTVVLLAGCRWPDMRPEVAQCLHYDEIQQRFIHNAFGPPVDPVDEQLLDLLVYHRLRAFELDLQPSAGCPGGAVSPTPDWYIYHGCGDFQSNVATLSEALEMLRGLHQAQPLHEVITLNLELGSNKTDKGNRTEFSTYSGHDLDQLLRQGLGPMVFTPAELLRRRGSRTLAEAVAPDASGGSGWPTTDELRGRVIVVIHGEANDLNRYFGTVQESIQNRAAFLMDEWLWNTRSTAQLLRDAPYAVFHGEVPTKDQATELRRTLPGHILRSQQIDDCNRKDCRGDTNRARVAEAQAAGMHLLYMNMGSANDPAFRTVNEAGYPFGASVKQLNGRFPVGDESWRHPSVIRKIEPGSALLLGDSAGGDLNNRTDTFVFAALPAASYPQQGWSAEITSASNRLVHPHGKGLLMARASLAPDAPYCAVGRTADRYGLRAQWRSRAGDGTGFFEQFGPYGNPASHLDRENWNFVQLMVEPMANGQQTRCRLFVSRSGLTWEPLGEDLMIAGALPYVGVAVASNSGFNVDSGTASFQKETRFSFVALRRSLGSSPMAPVDLQQLVTTEIGGGQATFDQRLDGPSASRCAPLR